MSARIQKESEVLLTFDYPFKRQGFGGGHQIFAGFAAELQRQGASVTLLASGPDEMGVFDEFPGRIHWVKTAQSRYTARQWKIGWVGFQKVMTGRFTTVTSFGGESLLVGLACQIRGIPFTTYVAAPEVYDFHAWKPLRNNLEQFYLYLASRFFAAQVFVLSSFLSDRVISRWRIAQKRVKTIGCGLHRAYLKQQREDLRSPEKYRIVSLGRIALDQKPLDRALFALDSVADRIDSWTIIGSGPDQNTFKKLLVSSPIATKVHLLGTLHPDSAAQTLLLADIVFLPSYQESMMLTVYEAAVAGKVIVTNDVADIKTHFTGVDSVCIAREPTVEGLSEAIRYAIDHWPRLFAGRHLARDRALERCDWAEGASAILSVRD
jgi:glycosyltransferase involved in cell wall biosynthesis